MWNSLLEGLFLLGMVIVVYFLSLGEGHTDGEIRAIAFSSLIIGNVFLILTKLSLTRSFLSVFAERNISVLIILSGALVMLSLILFIPALQKVFGFEFPGYGHFIPSLLGASLILAFLEVKKLFRISGQRLRSNG